MAPVFDLLRGIYENILRDGKVREHTPKPGHLLPTSPVRVKGLVLHDEEVYIRIPVYGALSIGTKENDFLRVH